jgi:hypothetical protein
LHSKQRIALEEGAGESIRDSRAGHFIVEEGEAASEALASVRVDGDVETSILEVDIAAHGNRGADVLQCGELG